MHFKLLSLVSDKFSAYLWGAYSVLHSCWTSLKSAYFKPESISQQCWENASMQTEGWIINPSVTLSLLDNNNKKAITGENETYILFSKYTHWQAHININTGRWITAHTFIPHKKHPNPIQPVTKTTGSLFLEPGSGWPSPSEACFRETFASKNSSKERAGNRHTFPRGKPISYIFPLYGWTSNNKSHVLLSNRLISSVTFLLCWPAFKTRP